MIHNQKVLLSCHIRLITTPSEKYNINNNNITILHKLPLIIIELHENDERFRKNSDWN